MQEEKLKKLEQVFDYLALEEIPYRTSNGGVHLIIELPKGRIDYWPTTGTGNIKSELAFKRPFFNGFNKLQETIDKLR